MIVEGVELFADEDGVLAPHPTGLLDMTNEQYHSAPGISKSHLDVIKLSPFAYWREYLDPEREPREETPDMALGTAIHAAVLEPDLFESNFAVTPPFNMRTNAGKQEFATFKAENPGKQILRPDDRDMALRCRDAVHRHPVAAALFRNGKSEQTFFANDPATGALIKCRFDYLHDGGGMAVDLKSVKDGAVYREAFRREIANHDYMLQPPWYFSVLRALYGKTPDAWVFVGVEKTRRPQIAIQTVTPRNPAFREAEAATRGYLERILLCKRESSWPDPGCAPVDVEMPGWWKP
jgi:exodeoxyribonuclease VIII